MSNGVSRRDILIGASISAATASLVATPRTVSAATGNGVALQNTTCPDGSGPLPDLVNPVNDAAYNAAKTFVTQRFTTQLVQGRPIDYGLKIAYLQTQAPFPRLKFSSRNVEQLAQQSASLLERGIASRSEYEIVAEKDLQTLTDLNEFLDRDDQLAVDVASGFYNIESHSAKAEADASKAFKDAAASLGDPFKPQVAAENARKAFLDERYKYECTAVTTRRERAQASRKAFALRVLSYADKHSPHNYASRLETLQQRFILDFASAVLRIPVLYKGLQEIFGYDQLPFKDSQTPFDDALLWLRNVAEFLVSFTADDQGYTLPVSVRRLVGDRAWTNAFSNNTGQVSFQLSEQAFPDQRHVRLRGVSVYAVTRDHEALYSVAVQPPKNSYIRHNDGRQQPLKQDVPLVRIGRVQSRSSAREADIVGAVTLNNVSPISGPDPWMLFVTDGPPALPNGAATALLNRLNASHLDDIVLDLHLAVQPA